MKRLAFILIAIFLIVSVSVIGGEWLLRTIAGRAQDEYRRQFLADHPDSGAVSWPDYSPTEDLIAAVDPYIGFRYAPNQRVLNRSVNHFGFRGDDWTAAKEQGVMRIVLMGGSVAESRSDSEAITRYLQDFLALDYERVEVLNCAITGMMSTQELFLLINEVLGYHPDLVLFLDGYNEFTPLRYRLNPGEYFYWFALKHRYIGDRPFMQNVQSIAERYHWKLVERSMLYRSLNGILGKKTNFDAADVSESEILQAAEIYRRNIGMIDLIGREHGMKSLFFLQPLLHLKRLKAPEEQYIESITPSSLQQLYLKGYEMILADDRHPPIIDITGIFDSEQGRLFTDQCHLVPRGNELIAQRMAEEIRRVLPPPR